MTLYSQISQPLISDLQMELASGERVLLNHSFVLPPGLPGVGQNDSGDRAPDSRFIVRSSDELPTTYSLPIPGILTATSPTALLDELNLLNKQLRECRKLWRGTRCFLPIAYAVLPQPEMKRGWLSCDVTPIFRISYLAWLDPEGNEVFG